MHIHCQRAKLIVLRTLYVGQQQKCAQSFTLHCRRALAVMPRRDRPAHGRRWINSAGEIVGV